ncbi:MAG: hypothetical protein M3R72_00675 [Bacteroidota bacterium]|nr:hypothetical protein [Bacteroidota bacterium]
MPVSIFAFNGNRLQTIKKRCRSCFQFITVPANHENKNSLFELALLLKNRLILFLQMMVKKYKMIAWMYLQMAEFLNKNKRRFTNRNGLQ